MCYLEENAKYMTQESRELLESLTAKQLAALLEVVEAPGIDCQVSRTNETLADFDAARLRWKRAGRKQAGDNYRIFEGVVGEFGGAKTDLTIVDVGDFRILCK